MREGRAANAKMCGNGSTEISGKQYSSQDGSLRNKVNYQTRQKDDADGYHLFHRVAQRQHILFDARWLYEFDDCIHQQKCCNYSGYDISAQGLLTFGAVFSLSVIFVISFSRCLSLCGIGKCGISRITSGNDFFDVSDRCRL